MNFLIEKVAEKYKIEKAEFNVASFYYDVMVPAVRFRHYLTGYGGSDQVFCFSQKDFFNDAFAEDVIDGFGGVIKSGLDRNPVSIYEFNSKSNPFMDRLLVLGPEAHGQFMSDVPDVHPFTFVVFPCHHSEFKKTDSPEDIHYARGKLVETLKWARNPQPRVRIRFEVDGQGGNMHSGEFQFVSLSFLNELISERFLNKTGLMKIEKYSGEVLDVKYFGERADYLEFSFTDYGILFDSILDWLKE